jgi:DNA excision repair protein ERCC-1
MPISNPYAKNTRKALPPTEAVVGNRPSASNVAASYSRDSRPGLSALSTAATSTYTRPVQSSTAQGVAAPVAVPTLAPMLDVGGSATFSQAFGSVEDTGHYQNQIAVFAANGNHEGSGRHQEDQEDRAQQRALDLNEQQQEQQQQHQLAPPDGTTDRDHHILLQPHVLYVSTRQRGNGVLKYIRNVPYAFSKMVPDYIMSATSCALFLSIKYHQLYPCYILRRLSELRTDFTLRILLVHVDVRDNASALLVLNKMAVTHNLTLILAWTEEEAARYLETFKALHGKDASSIQKREQTNFADQVADFLTSAKPINKTDAGSLMTHFSKVTAIMAASKDELALCEGMGPIKVQRLWDALHKPFSKKRAVERKRKREETEQIEKETGKDEGTASLEEQTMAHDADGVVKAMEPPALDDRE